MLEQGIVSGTTPTLQSIAKGRPNGMPAWEGKLTDRQLRRRGFELHPSARLSGALVVLLRAGALFVQRNYHALEMRDNR